jgi:hypothetical protein
VRFVLEDVALGQDLLWVCRFLLVISFHHWSTHIFIYVLLLSEGQTCDISKATKQKRRFENRWTFFRKVLLSFPCSNAHLISPAAYSVFHIPLHYFIHFLTLCFFSRLELYCGQLVTSGD